MKHYKYREIMNDILLLIILWTIQIKAVKNNARTLPHLIAALVSRHESERSRIYVLGRYDIADILLKVALKHQKSINKDHLLVAIFTAITTLDVYMFTTAGVRCNKI
jgi:hypothetical protein